MTAPRVSVLWESDPDVVEKLTGLPRADAERIAAMGDPQLTRTHETERSVWVVVYTGDWHLDLGHYSDLQVWYPTEAEAQAVVDRKEYPDVLHPGATCNDHCVVELKPAGSEAS